LIAIAIKLDTPGPVLFRQRRLGKDCEPFTIFKFRTMRHGADAAIHEEYMRRHLAGDADHAAVANGKKVFKPWPDHRITPVGDLLRRTSLDELPQLINVLRGEMSLVGFRPPIGYEVECYPDWYYARFAIKPGITGLWQVSGRNERSYEEMIELDIEYARRRTWKLDLVVLLKTVGVVLGRRGAY
jgi:lipopolysaccharide/colanic/teichoic acid biosynthesis glycosyltransferase